MSGRRGWSCRIKTVAEDQTVGEFTVGDLVRIKPYQVQTMSGLWVEAWDSGKLAIIQGFGSSSDWIYKPIDMADLRLISEGTPEAPILCCSSSDLLEGLELVTKGPGRLELGVTHPFSERELKEQRWQAWIAKCLGHDYTHEGWSNTATWCANLALTNDRKAMDRVYALRRKDGSINPDRLAKLFYEAKLSVDPEFFEPVFDPPESWAKPNCVIKLRQIDWQEIADDIAQNAKDNGR